MADDRLSDQEAIRAFGAIIAGRIERGEPAEAVRADLIGRGLTPKDADTLIALYAPRRWTLGAWGRAGRVVGLVSLYGGCVLAVGNKFGCLPTFPLAGTLAITLGAVLYTAAGGKWYRSSAPPAPPPDKGR